MAILRFGERLIRSGAMTQAQLEIVLAEQKQVDLPLGDLVVELGFATPAKVAEVVADMAGTRYEPLPGRRLDPALIELVDEPFARSHGLVPVQQQENRLVVALADPSDIVSVDQLREKTGMEIEVVVSTVEEIREACEGLYHKEEDTSLLQKLIAQSRAALENKAGSGGDELAPIVELVDEIIHQAVLRRGTDIHVEPEEKVVRLRYRIDGTLLPGVTLPNELSAAVTSRLKIISGLDISETRIPQDGRIRVEIGSRVLDLRVSTMPTVHGENIVMRLLDKSNVIKGLEKIGIALDDLQSLEAMLKTQSGMILVTGPTGSGKTTTLYSALASLDASRHKVATLEDPVEYQLPLVRQSQVREKAGFTFASGLRALLRQDPDIIFVGEMRDEETAGIAVRAAMTGHMVMSTLHTTSALGALPRLVQMGVTPDLLMSSLRGVLAQRLVRLVCSSCAQPAAVDPLTAHRLGIEGAEFPGLRRGEGCRQCSKTGHRGRIGLYELVRITPELADAFVSGRGALALTSLARAGGTRFLREDGLRKAAAGLTTLEEVLRATADAPVEESEADSPVTADV